MIHLISPNEGTLGTIRILAGAAATRGQYFAFTSETAPSDSSSALDVHSHAAYDESEYVLSGRREIAIDKQLWQAGAGFFALAPRHARHGMRTVGAAASRWLHFFSPAGIEDYFREREQLREEGASTEELRALSVSHGAAPSPHEKAVEHAYASDNAGPRDGRVLVTGANTRQAYALVERGALPVDPHLHADQEEAFYVISGEVSIESEGVTTTAAAGAFVLVPRGTPHRHITASGSMLLAIYSPGHTVPHIWEEPEV